MRTSRSYWSETLNIAQNLEKIKEHISFIYKALHRTYKAIIYGEYIYCYKVAIRIKSTLYINQHHNFCTYCE